MLGEGFTPEDEEDSAAAEVSKVWAYQARYRVPLAKAVAGLPCSTNNSDVLLCFAVVLCCSGLLMTPCPVACTQNWMPMMGVDASISKTAMFIAVVYVYNMFD